MSDKQEPKPELTPQMAEYLLTKLDQPIHCDGINDRNNLAIATATLARIANWKEDENVTDDGAGEGDGDTED